MADTPDMILPMLREMRAENAAGLAKIDERLAKLEATQVSFRQALGADSLFSKLVTGEFQERIEAWEQKVKELEGQK